MMNSTSVTHGQSQGWLYNCLRYLVPLAVPAVSLDGLSIDESVIGWRTAVVSIAFAILYSSKYSPIALLIQRIRAIPRSSLGAVLIITVFVLAIFFPAAWINIIEKRRALRIIDQSSANAFIELDSDLFK